MREMRLTRGREGANVRVELRRKFHFLYGEREEKNLYHIASYHIFVPFVDETLELYEIRE